MSDKIILSPLQRSVFFNLGFEHDDDGWKSRKQIRETDKNLKNRLIIPKGQNEFVDGSIIRFKSDFSNLSNKLSELMDKELVEERTIEVTFNKKKSIKIKQWRLIKNLKTMQTFWDNLVLFNLTNDINAMQLLLKAQFRKELPREIIDEWIGCLDREVKERAGRIDEAKERNIHAQEEVDRFKGFFMS